jgi:hypothetical protein
MTTMIALVGEQPQPNFLPVLHDNPDMVIFVYTSRTQEKYEHLKALLGNRGFIINGLETDPYDIPGIEKSLSEYLTSNIAISSTQMVFNLTGGTKTMAMAAYQIAAQFNAPVIYLQSEKGKSIIYRYNWQDNQLCFQQQEHMTEFLSLHDVLNLHVGHERDARGKGRWNENERKKDTSNGILFELAIAQVLKDHNYEVMCSVKDHDHQIDIDVIMRYENQIGIIEAKSGNNDKLKALQQLSAGVNFLRGTYIQPFLVSIGKIPSNG